MDGFNYGREGRGRNQERRDERKESKKEGFVNHGSEGKEGEFGGNWVEGWRSISRPGGL